MPVVVKPKLPVFSGWVIFWTMIVPGWSSLVMVHVFVSPTAIVPLQPTALVWV